MPELALLKKALFRGAFFMRLFLSYIALVGVIVFTQTCDAKSPAPQQSRQYHKVKWVYDGDTLLLEDKRKVRFIGIDTPEVAHHKQKGEVLGREAGEQLRSLLKRSNNQIYLEFDEDRQDRYQRTLAHVFLKDGTNISEWMLRNGWATLMVFPPNVKYQQDYANAQSLAQQERVNLWQLPEYQLKTPQAIKAGKNTYVRLKGLIKRINPQKNALFFELDNKIFIKLERRYLDYFDAYNPESLLQQQVIVSGELRKYRGKRTISVRHPVQLQVMK